MSKWSTDSASWSSDGTNWDTSAKGNSVSLGVTGGYSSTGGLQFTKSITLTTSFGDPSSWDSDSDSWASDSSLWRTGFLADGVVVVSKSASLGITQDYSESNKLTIYPSGSFGLTHDYTVHAGYNFVSSVTFGLSQDLDTVGNTTYPNSVSFPITGGYVANVNYEETATFAFEHDYANASSFLWTTMTESSDTWTTVTESSDTWTTVTEDSETWTSVH